VSAARPTAPAAPTNPGRGRWLPMPDDPLHPDQLDGEQRFRADLAAYLPGQPARPRGLADLLRAASSCAGGGRAPKRPGGTRTDRAGRHLHGPSCSTGRRQPPAPATADRR
jgi:hypothetical protein